MLDYNKTRKIQLNSRTIIIHIYIIYISGLFKQLMASKQIDSTIKSTYSICYFLMENYPNKPLRIKNGYHNPSCSVTITLAHQYSIYQKDLMVIQVCSQNHKVLDSILDEILSSRGDFLQFSLESTVMKNLQKYQMNDFGALLQPQLEETNLNQQGQLIHNHLWNS